MSHVVEATYENGHLKLERSLPLKDRDKVRVTVERLTTVSHTHYGHRTGQSRQSTAAIAGGRRSIGRDA